MRLFERLRDERGYTLIEMVVVSAVTFSLLLVVLIWVQSLSRSAGAGVNIDRTRADAVYLDRVIADDLIQATTCRVDGRDTIFAALTADTIDFYADVVDTGGVPTPDGVPDLVRWTFAGNDARRGVIAGTGTCPLDTTSISTASIAEPTFADGATPIITGYLDGVTAPSTTDCSVTPETCVYDSVAIRLRVTDAYTPSVYTVFDHRYLIDISAARD